MNRSATMAQEQEPETAASISDEALMQRYAGTGDAAAFDALYRRHRHSLIRYLQRNTRGTAVSEELFQDIWLGLIRNRQRYRPEASFRSYLFTLAHNRLVDHYRKQGREREVVQEMPDVSLLESASAPEGSTPHTRSELQQQTNRLLALIGTLPAAQRDVFLLREEGGFGIEEIAQITGAGAEAVKSRLRYAIARLRSGLEVLNAG